MGEVMYIECDMADEERLRGAIAEVEERWGRIHGVIHAAGITSGRSIGELTPVQELTAEDFALQFGPKIEGLEALKEVLGDRELDFCLLTSSLSAILGGLGFGAYASANSYMDMYIQGHRDRGRLTNWVSVNLDGLSFRDREMDERSLNNRELREVVEEVLLMTEQPQVIVSKGDLQRRLRDWVSGQVEEEQQEAEGEEAAGGETVTGTVTERKLHRLWQEFFGRERIGLDDDFFEIGGDSLKALTVIGRIHKGLNVQVSVTEFFRRPSIRRLAEYIDIVTRDKQPAPSPGTEPAPNPGHDELYVSEPTEPATLVRQILLQHPRVDDAIAFIHDYRHKGKYSLAFVVPNGIISTRKLKDFVAGALPRDQMPDYIIKCDQWPLNADGTINKKVLAKQAYTTAISFDLYIEPRTDLERQVAAIWREISGAHRVSMNDTFFDIGGTSAQLEGVNKAVGRTFSVELPLSVYQTFSLQQVVSRLTRVVKPVLENA
jgi:acyl carrier protein